MKIANPKDCIYVDVETNGFDYTELLCAAIKNGREPTLLVTSASEFNSVMKSTLAYNIKKGTYPCFVGHNIIGFDWWALRDLTGFQMPRDRVIDTSVVSRLLDYGKFNTHSLAELGESVGLPKMEYTGGFEKYTPEMGQYCKRDVDVCATIWTRQYSQLSSLDWSASFKVEHEMAFICAEMQRTGFPFNKHNAEVLLNEVQGDMSALEYDMQKAWPPQLVENRRIKYRVNKDGTPNAAMAKAQAAAPKWVRDGDEIVLYDYQTFNPGSPKQRIDKLWDAGWNPWDKTKGHILHDREAFKGRAL